MNWKLNYIKKKSLKHIILIRNNIKLKGKNKIIFNKSDSITKPLIGRTFLIYKGCYYRKLTINKFITSYKFGEFAYTRKPFRFTSKKSKK